LGPDPLLGGFPLPSRTRGTPRKPGGYQGGPQKRKKPKREPKERNGIRGNHHLWTGKFKEKLSLKVKREMPIGKKTKDN